jgi:hypothetical protein
MQNLVYNNEISFPISVSVIYVYFYYRYRTFSISDEQNLILDTHLGAYTYDWRSGCPVLQINSL